MASRSQKFRLGLFVVMSSLLLVILLVIIGTQQFLSDTDIYYIAYEDISVSGLEVGSPVKYLGLSVGTIKDIQIDPEDISRIIVTISIKEGTPIKQDAYADIELIGITGLKMIEIRGGSKAADLLNPGSYIEAGESTSEMITGKAEVIAEKLELLINNLNRFSRPENLDNIINMAASAGRTFESLDAVLTENRQAIRSLLAQTRQTSARLDTISSLLMPSVRALMEQGVIDSVGSIVSNVSQITGKFRQTNFDDVIEELAQTIDRTNRLLNTVDHDLERGSENLFISLKKLRSILQYLDETARMINEDPSILLRGTEYEDIPDENLDR